MKKMLLMLAMVFASLMPLQAQSFDEANLIGKWVRSAVMQPVDNYLVSIDSLWFGGGMWSYTRNDDDNLFQYYGCGKFYGQWQGKYYDPSESNLEDEYNTTLINDFSITNGDKLHITLGAGGDLTLIFKIISFTSTELVVQPLGSSNEIRFTKAANQSTGIKDARTSPYITVSTIYDISGKKLPKESKGVNIVKTDNGIAHKMLMK